jgi:hypothetical protein
MKTISTRRITAAEREPSREFLTPITESRLSVLVFACVTSGISWTILWLPFVIFLPPRSRQALIAVSCVAIAGFAITFLTIAVCTFRKNGAQLRRQLKAHDNLEADLRKGIVRVTRYRPEMIYRLIGHDEHGPNYCCRLGKSEAIVIISSLHVDEDRDFEESDTEQPEFVPSPEFEIVDLPGTGRVVSETMIGPPAIRIGTMRWPRGRPRPDPSVVFSFDWKHAKTVEP